ncbi:MAG: acyl-CoA thioesterase [Bacteroidaceae bacterium]|jgi:acyl-CoA thioester hydrolase|nr:acyl-CoA thioesterase [Bacteroidaceae bacterium]
MDCEDIVFHHVMPAQLRWSDVDQFGHVNNSVYFQLFDMCKTKYVLEVVGQDTLKQVAIVVASIKADFLAPIYYPDEIVIQSKITHMGNKSFIIRQRAVNIRTKEVKCEGYTTMVTYDMTNNCSIPIPDDFRAKVEAFENP